MPNLSFQKGGGLYIELLLVMQKWARPSSPFPHMHDSVRLVNDNRTLTLSLSLLLLTQLTQHNLAAAAKSTEHNSRNLSLNRDVGSTMPMLQPNLQYLLQDVGFHQVGPGVFTDFGHFIRPKRHQDFFLVAFFKDN